MIVVVLEPLANSGPASVFGSLSHCPVEFLSSKSVLSIAACFFFVFLCFVKSNLIKLNGYALSYFLLLRSVNS